MSFLTCIQYILACLISRCRETYLYDREFSDVLEACHFQCNYAPCNLVQLVRKIFAESLFPYISGWKASDRGKLSWETCSKQRTPRRAVEIPDVLLPVIFYFFYSPPIKVDPAQKSRESCAFYQSSAVKREFSSVGTPRVNQKAGNVLSSLVFQFHFFRQQKTSLTSLT